MMIGENHFLPEMDCGKAKLNRPERTAEQLAAGVTCM